MSEIDDLLRLVGKIYESALTPDGWGDTLESLGDLFDKSSVFMTLPTATTQGADGHYSARLDHSIATEEIFRQAFSPEDNVFVRTFPTMPLARPVNGSALQGDRDFERTVTYQHLFRPQKLHRSAGAVLIRESGLLSGIGLQKPAGIDDFDRADHDRLAVLLPHLSRALQVQLRLKALEAERDAALAALDRLPMGVALVGRDGRVIAMNSAAEALTRAADGLSVTAGTLRAAAQKETSALADLIACAAATGAGEGLDPGGAMALSRPSMLRPLSVLVAPLRSQALDSGPFRPAAIVFVSDPETEAETPEEILARLYGLTPAEARLAALLIQGHGLEWSAETLGVTINTARTHIKNLFDKTGVRRQAELVRLVLSGPGGLRQVDSGAG